MKTIDALLAEVARLEADNAALRHVATEQIALAVYADQDFGEEVGFMFLHEAPARVAWHRSYAAELLEQRLAALATRPARGGGGGR